MKFHDRPGWGIALRVVLVLLLIGGVVWTTHAAYLYGMAAGAGKTGPGYAMYADHDQMMDFHHQDGDYDEMMESHHQDGDQDYYHHSGEGFSHHPGSYSHHGGYAGRMGHYSGHAGPMGHQSGGGFGTGVFHFIFGILGFFLLVKLIFGFGRFGMHRYGHMGWGPGGHGHHQGCQCNCNCGEHEEEKAPEEKPKK